MLDEGAEGMMARTKWVLESGQEGAQAFGKAGSSSSRVVVALEAQTLEMWRSHSMTDQTGRKTGRIYQTTNEQRIESFFFSFIDVK